MVKDKLRVLDLFSGIGGFSLGLERTGGFETVAFCEIDPFCRRVMAKHWPNVRKYEDVRTLTADALSGDGIGVDVICGGFPCQDISTAGKGAGLDGERSGLWSEYARLVGELRPRFVIVENVAALLGRGLDRVLGDLASIGFDAEWHCIPASAVGAPHRRDRIWIVAHPDANVHAGRLVGGRDRGTASRGEGSNAREGEAPHGERLGVYLGAGSQAMAEADASGKRRGEARQYSERHSQRPPSGGYVLAYANGAGFSVSRSEPTGADGQHSGGVPSPDSWWAVEPNVGRVAHGVPARVDRLRSLGNAVVPQIPEIIGHAILSSLAKQSEAA